MGGYLKNIKLSIFVRILLASILPLIFIFSIVILNINRLIYDNHTEMAQERTVFMTRQATARVEITLKSFSLLLDVTSRDIATILASDSSEKQEMIDSFLRSLIETDPEIYSVWLMLTPGALYPDKRYDLDLLREGNTIQIIPSTPKEMLADVEATAWYHIPLKTGEPLFVTVDYYDFGVGKGREYTGSYGYPIKVNGEIVGVVGIDILYERAFAFIDEWEQENGQRAFLIAENGIILYSSDPQFMHRSIDRIPYSSDTRTLLRQGLTSRNSSMLESHSPLSGGDSLLYQTPLELVNAETSLYLLLDIPLSSLYHRAESATRVIVATSLLGLILLAVSVFFAVRNIVKPIKKLIASADQIANGKLDVSLDAFAGLEEPRHEVDQLGLSLSQMLDQLTQAHELKLYAMETEFEKKRVQEAADAKGRFFANMSHEIRTPMNAILGMSEILLACDLKTRERKYIRDIRTASDTLLKIINDILDFSKLESGKFELVETDYDLWEMLDNVYAICSLLANEKNLVFDIDIGKGVPHYLYGDDTRIKQVLLNIIGNAVKFTDSGFVKTTVTVSDGILRFDVEDTGVGIRAEDQQHMFQRFKQFDSLNKTRRSAGSGLGLSISYNLIDLMGGTISADSEFGKGSVFHIMLPLKLGDPRNIESRDEVLQSRFHATAKVLVVDDSEINLKVAKGLITLFDITVDTASSGAEALGLVQAGKYDIVFMDHLMPDMDGMEATRRIRAMSGRFERQVIIALSANAMADCRDACFEAGMNDFLAKPIEKAKLQAMLTRWIPKEKHGDTEIQAQVAAPDTRITQRQTAKRLESLANESPFLKQARGIPELNVDLGLDMVGGEEEFYLNMLKMTYMLSDTRKEKLVKYLAKEDFTSFVIEIHAAKGELANIGAVKLSDFAARLEKAARATESGYCRAHLAQFLNSFDELVGKLQHIFGRDTTSIY